MIQLHYYPGNASMIPHILLEEIGAPFELVRVNSEVKAHKTPVYLALNPNGLIPALTDGSLVLYETAAICLHLSDTHPHAALAPALGTAERAHLYKWLMWLTNTLQPNLLMYFYAHRYVAEGNVAGALDVKTQAEAKTAAMLAQLDAQLARVRGADLASGPNSGPWFMGADYTLLDAYVLVLCRWTRNFAVPARNYPHLGPYLQRLQARPAVQRVLAKEQLAPPIV